MPVRQGAGCREQGEKEDESRLLLDAAGERRIQIKNISFPPCSLPPAPLPLHPPAPPPPPPPPIIKLVKISPTVTAIKIIIGVLAKFCQSSSLRAA